jgi:SAM-dependent methyltransferase
MERSEAEMRTQPDLTVMEEAQAASPAEWYFEILACPNCSGALVRSLGALSCVACAFATERRQPLDLRPTEFSRVTLSLPRRFDAKPALDQVEVGRPRLTFDGPKGIRDGSELLSVMQQTLSGPGRVLDLGCGPRDQAGPIASLGHQYVGIDLFNHCADIRADAHALPFHDESFDFVFSYTVLQHLHNPFLGLQEVKRVLKPGGIYCGTVSQGEPFQSSFFHHTVWGILSLANVFDLQVLRLWSCLDTLAGLGRIGSYPRVLRAGLRAINWANVRLPFLSPRKMRWPAREKALDELYRSAHIGFLIRK